MRVRKRNHHNTHNHSRASASAAACDEEATRSASPPPTSKPTLKTQSVTTPKTQKNVGADSNGLFSVLEIATPTFSVIKASRSKKVKKEQDEEEEDISDAAVKRLHGYYEKLERQLHQAYLSGTRPPLVAPVKPPFEYESLPDTFFVQFDDEEIVSDPLPPPPRVLRTPARFLDGAISGTATMRSSANVVVRLAADVQSMLPMRLGVLSVLSLGRIVWDRPGFFTERYFFPVGFLSEREYVSGLDPSIKTTYRCEILEGDHDGPVFRVTPLDDARHPVQAETPSKCWSEVLRRINAERIARDQRPVYTAVSGPEYFGIDNPRVAALFEQLDNADKCAGYRFRYFDPAKRAFLEDEHSPLSAPSNGSHSHQRKKKRTSSFDLSDADTPAVAEQQLRKKKRSCGPRKNKSKKESKVEATDGAAADKPKREKRPRKQLYEYVLEPIVDKHRLLLEEALRVGPSCTHCGGERGDLLKCSECEATYHLRCIEPTYRPLTLTQRWSCAACVIKSGGDKLLNTAPRKRGRPRKVVVTGGEQNAAAAAAAKKKSATRSRAPKSPPSDRRSGGRERRKTTKSSRPRK